MNYLLFNISVINQNFFILLYCLFCVEAHNFSKSYKEQQYFKGWLISFIYAWVKGDLFLHPYTIQKHLGNNSKQKNSRIWSWKLFRAPTQRRRAKIAIESLEGTFIVFSKTIRWKTTRGRIFARTLFQNLASEGSKIKKSHVPWGMKGWSWGFTGGRGGWNSLQPI